MEYLQQLELECPFCSETQPSESAMWDDRGIGYTTICQGCGKVFSGLSLVSVYHGTQSSASSLISDQDGYTGETPRF
jgi:uncharacterized Zn finger protein